MNQFAMPQLLKGQQALVTGANSGIGKAVAIALGRAGANVIVNYVHGDDAANWIRDDPSDPRCCARK